MAVTCSFTLKSLCLAAVGALCMMDAQVAQAGQVRPEVTDSLRRGVPHVTNEVLVQFRPGLANSRKTFVLQRVRATQKNVVAAARPVSVNAAATGDLVVVSLPRGLTVAQALGTLSLEQDVVFAEPNWIYRHQATSNDPYYTNGSLWGMYGASTSPANIYGSGASAAWTNGKTNCSSVYVGIIDEG